MAKERSFLTRSLQTLAVTFYSQVVLSYFSSIGIILYVGFFTKYWPLVILLFFWTFYDRETPSKGGRPSRFLKWLPIFKFFRGYFPMSIVKTADLDPERNYIFCTHPHGLIGTGNFGNFLLGYSEREELFPGLEFYSAADDCNMIYPIHREEALAYGFVAANYRSLMYLLEDNKKGNVVNLMIGGSDEFKYMIPGQYKIVLEKRKGFVKLAMQAGCSLVPVFVFGENDAYEIVLPAPGSFVDILQKWVKKKTNLHFSRIRGRTWLFPLLPKRVPIVSVVGKPINVPKVENPTREQVQHYHSLYKEALIKLFNEHKYKYVSDPENTHLIIAE